MATLSEQEKAEIVTLLACFNTPAQVVVRMREHSGVEVDRFQVRAYDPTNARYEGGEKWRSMFEQARAAYLDSFEDVPIARPAYRLNELQKNYDRASQAGNLVLANSILKQAAWEVGRIPAREAKEPFPGYFSVRDMSPEERRAKFAQLIDEAFGRKGKQAAAAGPALVPPSETVTPSAPEQQQGVRNAA
jgi:hypothetical protein